MVARRKSAKHFVSSVQRLNAALEVAHIAVTFIFWIDDLARLCFELVNYFLFVGVELEEVIIMPVLFWRGIYDLAHFLGCIQIILQHSLVAAYVVNNGRVLWLSLLGQEKGCTLLIICLH